MMEKTISGRGAEEMKEKAGYLGKLTASMVIFGTVGVFRRWITLPSSAVAAARGIVGAAFLLALCALRGNRVSGLFRQNRALLLLSGAAMGLNWIALFEAYRFTTVAVATLCYYTAPMLVLLASPLLLRERLTAKNILCMCVTLLGMLFVSGALEGGGAGSARGVLLALGAAVLYAAVVLMNKRMRPMDPEARTIVQLLTAGVVVLPYALAEWGAQPVPIRPLTVLMLAVVCIVHTGAAYSLYFGCVERLPAHTLALLSYLDPVVAVLLSALLLREPLSGFTLLGAALILGASAAGELTGTKR